MKYIILYINGAYHPRSFPGQPPQTPHLKPDSRGRSAGWDTQRLAREKRGFLKLPRPAQKISMDPPRCRAGCALAGESVLSLERVRRDDRPGRRLLYCQAILATRGLGPTLETVPAAGDPWPSLPNWGETPAAPQGHLAPFGGVLLPRPAKPSKALCRGGAGRFLPGGAIQKG